MRRRHSCLAPKKRGDITAVGSPSSPTVFAPVSRLYRSDIIFDVKLLSKVSGPVTVLNPSALLCKANTHRPVCAPLGFGFRPFAASCFGGLGPPAIQRLYIPADYELRQDDWLVQQGFDPPADRRPPAQHRQPRFRQPASPARMGRAIAKAAQRLSCVLWPASLPVSMPASLLSVCRYAWVNG